MNIPTSFYNNAHWLLRLALASVFLYHGIGKVTNFSGFVEMMGLPARTPGRGGTG